MTNREKVYLKDLPLYDEVDHSASAEQFPEAYAKLDTLTHMSHKKLVWECSVEGHDSWESNIKNRSVGQGCPTCGRISSSDIRSTPKPGKSLGDTFPSIAFEWDQDKNGSVTPEYVTYKSNRKFWWICKAGHSWEARVGSRTAGCGCPYCSGRLVTDNNRLSILYPSVALEWDLEKNGTTTPEDVTSNTKRRFWWLCKEGHSWESSVGDRTRGYGCPYCSGRLVTDNNRLSIRYPSVALEWDYDKNGTVSPEDVSVSSHRRFWWLCKAKHSWYSPVGDRTRGRGCPYCSGRMVTDSNRLSIHYPSVALEWDRDKNGTTTPEDVTSKTSRKFWWLCKAGHSWESSVCNRTAGKGCPKCAKRTSKIENRFIEAFTDNTDFILTEHGMKLNQIHYSSGQSGVEVDMIFFFNHHYLLLEYDGSYWHRDKIEADTEKSRALLFLGDNILHARIREDDLPDLDLVHGRFAQFRHDYHAIESDSIERTVKEIERWFLEKIGE